METVIPSTYVRAAKNRHQRETEALYLGSFPVQSNKASHTILAICRLICTTAGTRLSSPLGRRRSLAPPAYGNSKLAEKSGNPQARREPWSPILEKA